MFLTEFSYFSLLITNGIDMIFMEAQMFFTYYF